AYGNGQFVALGFYKLSLGKYKKITLTSTDGAHWTQRQDNYNDFWVIGGLGYGKSQFVAVEDRWGDFWDTIIQTSADGVTWDAHASGTSPYSESFLNSFAYGSGYFAAVGGAEDYYVGNWRVHGPLIVVTSTDGGAWVQRLQSGRLQGAEWFAPGAMAYGNGHFVAVGPGGTILQSGSIIILSITPSAGSVL